MDRDYYKRLRYEKQNKEVFTFFDRLISLAIKDQKKIPNRVRAHLLGIKESQYYNKYNEWKERKEEIRQ